METIDNKLDFLYTEINCILLVRPVKDDGRKGMVVYMDGDGSWAAYLIVCLILILLSAFFNASKASIVAFSDSKLKKMAEDGHKKAKRLQSMLKSPTRFMDSCEILGFLFAFGALAVLMWLICVVQRTQMLMISSSLPWFERIVTSGWKSTLFLAVTILISTFFLYLLCFSLPKRLAERRPEKFAFFCLAPLSFFRGLFLPFTWLLSTLSNGFSRLFNSDGETETEDATEEEIRMMVDVGNEKGVIEESQKDMINNIFEFDDRTVEDVMTHRTEIIAVSREDTISDIVYYAINEGYSRIPVYEEDIDNIVGVIYVKDLLCLVGCKSTEDFKISDFIRPVLYVPESNRCGDLFKEFSTKKAHLAVVVDEYGGTSGIVTMEDLLEAIVGNIQDEYDDDEVEIQKMADNVYVIDGGADLEDAAEELGLELKGDEDYDTLGGLITDILGRIPDDGETPSVSYQDIDFTVLEVKDQRILKVKAVVRPPAEEKE